MVKKAAELKPVRPRTVLRSKANSTKSARMAQLTGQREAALRQRDAPRLKDATAQLTQISSKQTRVNTLSTKALQSSFRDARVSESKDRARASGVSKGTSHLAARKTASAGKQQVNRALQVGKKGGKFYIAEGKKHYVHK